jgi:hypothetical protein
MRNNQLAFILVGVFFLTAVGTAVLSYRFINSVRTLQGVQQRLSVVNYTKGFLNQLGAETAEYAKKDPAINAVIQPGNAANAAAMLPPPAAK